MQPIAFCNRCRGMKVGWNRRYVAHCLKCREWLAKSVKILVLTGLLSSFVFAFPVTTGMPPNPPDFRSAPTVAEQDASVRAAEKAVAIEKMLAAHDVDKDRLPRLVHAIMASSGKYGVDPRLVA